MDDVLKRRLWIAVIASALVLVGAGAIWLGRPAYRSWKQRRFLAQAQAFLAKGDFANASLSARQVLALNPSNLAACQLMAGMAEMAGSPAVLDWRRRIADISPTPDNRLMLAATAVRHQRPPYTLAGQILNDMSAGSSNLPAFHLVSAELAIRLKDLDKAELHLEAAARLEPTNELYKLNLATLRLGSTNAAMAAEARATLESLGQSTNLGAVALRSLATDAVRRQDFAAAGAWSAQLITNPRCASEDRLQHLDLLLRDKDAGFASYLGSLKQRGTTNVAEVRGLATWLIQRGRAGEGLRWLTNLPPAVRAQQPVPLTITEAYAALTNWSGVQTFLADEHWADMEFLRLAFLSQASLQKKELTATTLWRSAVREAGERLGALGILLNLADGWQRPSDKEDLLWHIYERHPAEQWTLRELGRLYQAQGDTRGLNKLFGVMAELNPKDLAVRNNFAATSLLLNLNVDKAYEMAKQLCTEQPDDAILASTYAFALHLRGKTAEGLAILRKMKPEDLEKPPVALYYGVLLSASGQASQARKYLDLGQGGSLLPEEKQLLATARKAT